MYSIDKAFTRYESEEKSDVSRMEKIYLKVNLQGLDLYQP